MIENYINYGECVICHKVKRRVMGIDMCEDCLDKYIDETKGDSKCEK